MEITTKTNGQSVDIYISGIIKTISDGQSIKETITRIFAQDAQQLIHVHIKDSFIITSSVIGFLIKSIEPLANSNHCKQLISSHSNF